MISHLSKVKDEEKVGFKNGKIIENQIRHYDFFPIVVCLTVDSPITATTTYIETCTFPEQFIEMGVILNYSYPDHKL